MRNSLKILKRCSSNRLALRRVLYNPRNNFKKLSSPSGPSLTLQAIRAYGHTNCRRLKDCFVKSNSYKRIMLNAKLEREEDTLNLNAYKRSDM